MVIQQVYKLFSKVLQTLSIRYFNFDWFNRLSELVENDSDINLLFRRIFAFTSNYCLENAIMSFSLSTSCTNYSLLILTFTINCVLCTAGSTV